MSEVETTKICTLCKVERPILDFHKAESTIDGYRHQCKSCVAEYQKTWKERGRTRDCPADLPPEAPGGEARRVCKTCNETRPISRFAPFHGGKWRLRECRDCVSKKKLDAKAVWRNEEGRKAACRRYYLTHKDRYVAHSSVSLAIARGDLAKVETRRCVLCPSQAAHYHHWSYEEVHRIDVVPVCERCHGLIHTRLDD